MVSAMWYLGARIALLRTQAVSVSMDRVRIHILIPINNSAVTVCYGQSCLNSGAKGLLGGCQTGMDCQNGICMSEAGYPCSINADCVQG